MANSDSVGWTPLEAAARAMTGGMNWDLLSDESQNEFREWARAALTAAIDALPPMLEIGSVWDNQMATDSGYESRPDEDGTVYSVYWSRLKVNREPWLRRALGLEGDQG